MLKLNLRIVGWLVITSMLIVGCSTTSARKPSVLSERPPTAAPATQPAAAPDTPLKALQAVFRPSYNAARDAVDLTLSPLVIVRFSDMFLIKDGKVVEQAKGIPQKYHLLHRTAHVPFVVWLETYASFGKPLSAECADKLMRYRGLMVAAVGDLANYGFTAEEIAWQETVLNESAGFLQGVQSGSILTEDQFGDLQRRTHGAMMSLADAAGAAQVDATHATMGEWRQKLTQDEWEKLRVAIVGFRQPRHDYAATQYFAALFPGDGNSMFPGENERVIYIEDVTIDRTDMVFADARRAVASMLLDADASEVMFNNSYRMSIDVMADGARRRIGELDFDDLR